VWGDTLHLRSSDEGRCGRPGSRTFRRAFRPPSSLSRIFAGIGTLDGAHGHFSDSMPGPLKSDGGLYQLSTFHQVLWNRFQDLPSTALPKGDRRGGFNSHRKLRTTAVQRLLASKKTVWTTVVVSQWYNAQQRKLLTATGTAVWYHAGIPPVPIRWVLVRDPTGEHEPAAFLSTDLDATPATILDWFVSRWRVETTFQEVRTHLGVETQRQWSDLAILRTTPALLGLFSLITVWADGLARDTTTALRPNAAAWYRKQEPTFSDAIAAVRRVLWCPPNFSMSRQIGDIIEIPKSLLNRVFQTLCLAA